MMMLQHRRLPCRHPSPRRPLIVERCRPRTRERAVLQTEREAEFRKILRAFRAVAVSARGVARAFQALGDAITEAGRWARIRIPFGYITGYDCRQRGFFS